MIYKLYKNLRGEMSPHVLLIDDEGMVSSIPCDEANMDWVRYQEWLDEGNEPEEADA